MLTALMYRSNERVFLKVTKITTLKALAKNWTNREASDLFSFYQKEIKKVIKTRTNTDNNVADEVRGQRKKKKTSYKLSKSNHEIGRTVSQDTSIKHSSLDFRLFTF